MKNQKLKSNSSSRLAEAAGSNLVDGTGFEPRPFLNRIFNVIWELKSKGYSERTIHGYSKRLRMLAKHVNLDNPDSVNRFIATQDEWPNAYKINERFKR